MKHFYIREGLTSKIPLRAVDDVSIRLEAGTTLGIVGESGCGKSTLARLLLGLLEPTSGDVLFKGKSLFARTGREQRAVRQDLQIVFQDPFSSLNPWMTVGQIVERPLAVHDIGDKNERRDRVRDLLRKVGLPPESETRLPHEFSGGQRQRVAIARALATSPEVIVADEPTSGLDVSVQATILNLLRDLQDELGLSYIFISHDIRVVRHMCDMVAVMYLGEILEQAPAQAMFRGPMHPYTLALLSSVPDLRPTPVRLRPSVEGDPPSALQPPPACRFHPRCRHAEDVCRVEAPDLRDLGSNHLVSCHFAEQISSSRTDAGAEGVTS